MKPLLATLGLLAGLLGTLPVQAQSSAPGAPAVATVAAVDGTVFVTRPDGRQSVLARGSALQVGDAINTTRNSSARLKFGDGGETVVRPESTLQVQAYHYQAEQPAQDNLLLRLFKGGMRALTGAIGKRGNADAYQLRTSTATVGIRGTEFSLRLCQNDCSEESGKGTVSNAGTPVAARAVQVRGSARVSRNGAAMVALTEGQPLYAGDVLQTLVQSHVVLVFSDGTRITVNPTSQMGIPEYDLDKSATAKASGNMVIDMFKGGLRFATGLIGKLNPERVKVRTSAATIGIRGTVFDLACAGSGSADGAAEAGMGEMSCDESLFAQTREGLISLSGQQGEPVLLVAGQSGRVNGPNTPARLLPGVPQYFREQATPLPEGMAADLDALFGVQMQDTGNGVLLTVHEGRVVLAQAELAVVLDAGESAFAGATGAPVRLLAPPPVLDGDPFLSSGMFRPNMCRR